MKKLLVKCSSYIRTTDHAYRNPGNFSGDYYYFDNSGAMKVGWIQEKRFVISKQVVMLRNGTTPMAIKSMGKVDGYQCGVTTTTTTTTTSTTETTTVMKRLKRSINR